MLRDGRGVVSTDYTVARERQAYSLVEVRDLLTLRTVLGALSSELGQGEDNSSQHR